MAYILHATDNYGDTITSQLLYCAEDLQWSIDKIASDYCAKVTNFEQLANGEATQAVLQYPPHDTDGWWDICITVEPYDIDYYNDWYCDLDDSQIACIKEHGEPVARYLCKDCAYICADPQGAILLTWRLAVGAHTRRDYAGEIGEVAYRLAGLSD
jgi:hypothetical protein